MKSSLLNMVLVLLVITAVGSTAVGLVYNVTKDPIGQAKVQKKLDALTQVLPEFDNAPTEEIQAVEVDGAEMKVYTAKKGGDKVGYAVESFTMNGFSGLISIMAGFDVNGNIINIEVLEQNETPGLGAKLADGDNPVKVSFVGRNPSELKMSVRKDGGDIDAITASTISSRAYTQAVSRAYTAFLMATGASMDGWDATSGSTASASEGSNIEADPAGGHDPNAADALTGATGMAAEGTIGADSASGATGSAGDAATGATTTKE